MDACIVKIFKILRPLLLVGLTLISFPGYALTPEVIQTDSAKGSKLKAAIPLTKIKIPSIKKPEVSIASKQAYKRFRIKYSSIINTLRVTVKRRKDRGYYIVVTSSEPIKRSSLKLLIKLKQGATTSYRLYELRLADKISHGGELKIIAPAGETEVVVKKPALIAKKPISVISPQKPAKVISQKPIEVKSSAKSEVPTSVPKSAPKSTAKMANGEEPDEAAPAESSHPGANLESYYVDLRADEELEVPGDPGELVVWIGDEKYKPAEEAGKASAHTMLPAVGQTAKVIPFAPTFKVEPAEYVCMKVHPTGSEAVFSITPLKTGDHEIGATVHMFESDDCTGAAVPKSVKKLLVTVRVGTGEIIEDYGLQLWDKFWEELLNFWGLILATFFGLLLFLVRKKLKKLFGYEEKLE